MITVARMQEISEAVFMGQTIDLTEEEAEFAKGIEDEEWDGSFQMPSEWPSFDEEENSDLGEKN